MAETIKNLIGNNTYPGRGIIIGKDDTGKNAVIAYFIMGRSENSRNRVFEYKDNDLYAKAFDESKVKDPSLIIYRGYHKTDEYVCVSNGNQTDNMVDGMENGKTFEESLAERQFEPDPPNYTPRISGLIKELEKDFSYTLSILQSKDQKGLEDERHFYTFKSEKGKGRFISTYVCDGNPLPTFKGEPKEVSISGNIDEFINEIWSSLNTENRISLFCEYIDLETKKSEYRIINKNVR